MKKPFLILIVFAGLLLAGWQGMGAGVSAAVRPHAPHQGGAVLSPARPPIAAPRRIVSLAPSITETLFLLGLGDEVAGVTRFCAYPPAARKKPVIGGYCDPNYEAIAALRPDLVIMLIEHAEARRNLEKLGLKTLVVDHRSIGAILNSIAVIGRACGKGREARAAVGALQARMERVRRLTGGLARPRVMVTVGRNMGSGRIEDVYINGKGGFYSELITLAGGVNAYSGSVAYPSFAEEGIMRINPEVIIDMVPDLGSKALDRGAVIRQWRQLGRVAAVRDARVHVFGQDYAVIPGPRCVDLLEAMARAIHPEAPWGSS